MTTISPAARERRPGVASVPASLSVVVPAFDEAVRLESSLDRLVALASPRCEVLFVDDGSRDATPKMLASARATSPHVRVCTHDRNRGKGAAVRTGFAAARGEAIVFMDADLATDLADLEVLVAGLRDAEVAIGSRSHAGAVVASGTGRAHMGRVFNAATRAVTGLDLSDTQCGFKAFRASYGKLLLALSQVDGYAFDVELLLLADRLGLRVNEVPVHWHDVEGSHINVLTDPLRMLTDVVRTRARIGRTFVPTVRVGCDVEPPLELADVVSTQLRRGDAVVAACGEAHVVVPDADQRVLHTIAERVGRACDRAATVTALPADLVLRAVSSGASSAGSLREWMRLSGGRLRTALTPGGTGWP